MARRNRTYAPLDFERLRGIRGYPLTSLMRAPTKIPTDAGVYIWRYWPSLRSLEEAKFVEMCTDWQQRQPRFKEEVRNSRVEITTVRTPFGRGESGTFLGIELGNPKVRALLTLFKGDSDTRQLVAYTMECLIAASPPLYIGKANCLRKRLEDHFKKRSSDVLDMIDEAGIARDDVYVSYFLDPAQSSDGESVATGLEEILQRLTNPPFTKRYG